MHPNRNDQIGEWRRETEALIAITENLLAELDAGDEHRSRPSEIALDLQTRLRRRHREIITDRLANTTTATPSNTAALLPLRRPSPLSAANETRPVITGASSTRERAHLCRVQAAGRRCSA